MISRAAPLFAFLLVAGAACASRDAAPPQADRPLSPGLSQETSPAEVVEADAPGCTEPQSLFVTDMEIYGTPTMPEPPARVGFRDPTFGSCLIRATDRKADLMPGDPSPGLKNEYSRVQSFNADGTRILVRGIEATWYLYDVLSLQPLAQLPLGNEPRWSAVEPDLVYFTSDTRLMSHDVATGAQELVHEFALDFPGKAVNAVWSRHEGSPSRDDRYWGFMTENGDWMAEQFLVYDQESDRIVARRDLPAPAEVDNVTISPLGTYFVAQFDECEHGEMGSATYPCGLMVYDADLANPRGLLRVVGHSDIALDPAGREVLVYQDIDTDHISMLDLATGETRELLAIDFSHSPLGFHISGRAFQRPGWALVSTSAGARPSATWMDDQLFALELKVEGSVVRLAHTHSVVDQDQEHDYWAEPHASTNPDFTRLVFTSNWGRSGSGEVEMYLVELPWDWPELATGVTEFRSPAQR